MNERITAEQDGVEVIKKLIGSKQYSAAVWEIQTDTQDNISIILKRSGEKSRVDVTTRYLTITPKACQVT
jgi:hypothetical protein